MSEGHPTCKTCRSGLDVLVNAPSLVNRKMTAAATMGAKGKKPRGKKRAFNNPKQGEKIVGSTFPGNVGIENSGFQVFVNVLPPASRK